MSNEEFAKQMVEKISENRELYDNGSSMLIQDDVDYPKQVFRTFQNGGYAGAVNRDGLVSGIVDRLEKGLSERSDYKII